MHAYLLIGKNQGLIKDEVENIVKRLDAKYYYQDLTKIKHVRELKQYIKLKVDEPTAIVSENIESASTEALNAFLKMLEEPQKDLYFILTTTNIHKITPTVQSRCQIIKLKNEYKYDEELIEKYEQLMANSISDKFTLINEYKSREDAIHLISNFIIWLYSLYKNDLTNTDLLNTISLSENTLLNLKRNGNVKLQLTNLLINI